MSGMWGSQAIPVTGSRENTVPDRYVVNDPL